jgi:cytochrome b6-f complex iron-sulfur subunit
VTVTPKPGRSRLDPEVPRRRDVLGLASLWTMASALFFVVAGVLRLPKAAVMPVATRKFNVQLPESLAPGAMFEPAGRNVALARDAQGAVHAISKMCPHLGCIVKATPAGFECPCHGSRFGPDGEVLVGPAPKGLSWLQVTGESGDYVVDESAEVPPGTRTDA